MNQHTQLLLARAVRVVAALAEKGCTVTRITIEGALPLIEIDRPPMNGPAMTLAIRSNGRTPRTVWVAEWRGCRIEAPARRPRPNRPAVPVFPRQVAA